MPLESIRGIPADSRAESWLRRRASTRLNGAEDRLGVLVRDISQIDRDQMRISTLVPS